MADGSKYYGEINNENGKPHGYGLLMSREGDTYADGQWVNGSLSGKGGLVVFGEFEYLGDFLNDKMHGYGIYKDQ
jgi:hypothetical protein